MRNQSQNTDVKRTFAPLPVLPTAFENAGPDRLLRVWNPAIEATLTDCVTVPYPGGSLTSGFTSFPGMDVREHRLPPLRKGEALHGDHTVHMTLRDLYRQALAQGGDAVSRALGHAEAELERNPANRQALTYKGSLLTMVGEAMLSDERRRDYIRSGLAIMHTAMALPGSYPTVAWELTYLRATTLAMLPADLGHDSDALALLQALRVDPNFAEQPTFERARSLALLACEAELNGNQAEARDVFTAARSIDEPLAIKTCADWQKRGFATPTPPASSDT